MKIRSKRFSRGMTLLEVLIAVLVLSIGLMGIAALQARGQQANVEAQIRTHATILASQLLERMRINRPQARNGGYAFNSKPSLTDCRTNSCTTTQLRDFDIASWLTQVETTLPDGVATAIYTSVVGAPGSSRYEVAISWALRDAEQDNATSTMTRKSMTWTIAP